MTISKRKNHSMNLYQVDINTEIDAISVLLTDVPPDDVEGLLKAALKNF